LQSFLILVLFALVFFNGYAYAQPNLLDCFDFDKGGDRTINLPVELREVSGLALTPNNTLLAHNDESMALYELNIQTGEVLASLKDSNPVSQADYEGITLVRDQVLLVSSKGNFVRASYPLKTTSKGNWSSRLGDNCEIEGLTYRLHDNGLVAVCKKIKDKESKREVRLLTVFPGSSTSDLQELSVILPDKDDEGVKQFSGSGVIYHEALGRYLVLSSNNRVIAEISEGGKLLGLSELKKKVHPQPEGIELSADLELFIANEGSKKKPGTLVVYKPLKHCVPPLTQVE
jgi:uncharacterized protein YjiK